MQILNSLDNTVGLGADNNSDTVGIVIKTAEELGFPGLGVFIPKFMLGYQLKSSEKAEEKTVNINNSKCVNDKSIGTVTEKSLVLKNYITVRPLLNQNQFMPEYTVGDKVIVKIIDNDIKTLMFYPYSINRLGQRATDKLLLVIPANKEENTALSEDNTYFIKLDSKNKNIEITASNVNGETCRQTILLNPGDGLINITDNENLIWTMDTKNDSIRTQTSGAILEMKADVINMKADTLNIEMDSEVKIKTDISNINSGAIKAKSDDVNLQYDNFKQKTDNGTWEIRNETHNVSSIAFKNGSTFHVDIPTIGLNGKVILQNFVIGSVSNPNLPVLPLNGDSGQSGSMLLKTSVTAMPLVKFAPLMTVLSSLAAGAAMPMDSGASASVLASMTSQLMTTKILGE